MLNLYTYSILATSKVFATLVSMISTTWTLLYHLIFQINLVTGCQQKLLTAFVTSRCEQHGIQLQQVGYLVLKYAVLHSQIGSMHFAEMWPSLMQPMSAVHINELGMIKVYLFQIMHCNTRISEIHLAIAKCILMVVRNELIKLFPSIFCAALTRSCKFEKQLLVAKCSDHIHSASNLSP